MIICLYSIVFLIVFIYFSNGTESSDEPPKRRGRPPKAYAADVNEKEMDRYFFFLEKLILLYLALIHLINLAYI